MSKRTMDPRRIEVVDEAVAEILRRKTPAEKIEMAFGCSRLIRQVIEGRIRSLHPGWTDEEVAKEVSRRISSGTD
jgi:hypothetical protein